MSALKSARRRAVPPWRPAVLALLDDVDADLHVDADGRLRSRRLPIELHNMVARDADQIAAYLQQQAAVA